MLSMTDPWQIRTYPTACPILRWSPYIGILTVRELRLMEAWLLTDKHRISVLESLPSRQILLFVTTLSETSPERVWSHAGLSPAAGLKGTIQSCDCWGLGVCHLEVTEVISLASVSLWPVPPNHRCWGWHPRLSQIPRTEWLHRLESREGPHCLVISNLANHLSACVLWSFNSDGLNLWQKYFIVSAISSFRRDFHKLQLEASQCVSNQCLLQTLLTGFHSLWIKHHCKQFFIFFLVFLSTPFLPF